MATSVQIDSAQLKLISLERQGEAWLLDHHEAEECHKFQNFITMVGELFADVFDLDLRIREDHLQSGVYNEDLFKTSEILVMKCYFLAVKVERTASWFEKKGHAVEGIVALRAWLEELRSCNQPSDEVPDWLESKRLNAVDEQRHGRTLVGWAD